MIADADLVLSLSQDALPCEFAGRLAVDAGCSVVKLEPAGGDPLRLRRPLLADFLLAGKHSVTVGAGGIGPRGLDALAARAGAILCDESHHAQALELSGAHADLPVVLVGERDSGGLQGMSTAHSDEFLSFHGSGLGYLTPRVMPGYPSAGPLCPDANLLEFLTGLYGAIALFAVLGGAQPMHATAGLCAAALPLLRREISAVLLEGAAPHRGERIWKVSPAEVHRCRDGWLFVDVIEDIQWQRLCEYMGKPELGADARYTTRERRFAHAETLCAMLDAFFADQPQSCWIEAQARGVPIAPVNSLADLAGDEQLAARDFWGTLVNADGRKLRSPVTPLQTLFGSGSAALQVPGAGAHTAVMQAQADAR